jgi:hypothetical protein
LEIGRNESPFKWTGAKCVGRVYISLTEDSLVLRRAHTAL